MCALALTSKEGYHSSSINTTWYDRKDSKSVWVAMPSTSVIATSYKSPKTQGDKLHATNYSRKVARITSLNGPEFSYNPPLYLRQRKGDSAIHSSSGLTLAGNPFGNTPSGPGVVVSSWMVDKVIQDCLVEINDFGANILEDFAEAQKTIGQLWSIFRTICEWTKLAYNGNWSALATRMRALGYNFPRGAAGTWLGYYYGIRPLISTMDAVSKSYESKDKEMTVSRSIKSSLDPHYAIGQWPPGWDTSNTGEAYEGAKCGLKVAAKLDSDVRYLNSLGLTGSISDLIVTGWALLPYSFVVDWVIPVERFLRTRSWSSGLVYQTGYVNRKIEAHTTHTLLTPLTGRGQRPKAKVDLLFFQREAFNTYPPPSGVSIKLSLTSTQAFNAAALILARS